MYCGECGNKLNDGDKFCDKCGAKNVNFVETNNTTVSKTVHKNICPSCHSDNVNIQIVNESHLKNAHHGFLWWLIIGWWWVLVKWLCFFWIALIFKIFGVGGKKKIVNKQKKVYVCQNCGKTF